ncbi:MAG: hypothetical protein D6714_16655 [Bacteroidetes bacterium]|nr:MAG: hypothetical protein D6714_16655 [Bacteroidota bacterium]
MDFKKSTFAAAKIKKIPKGSAFEYRGGKIWFYKSFFVAKMFFSLLTPTHQKQQKHSLNRTTNYASL